MHVRIKKTFVGLGRSVSQIWTRFRKWRWFKPAVGLAAVLILFLMPVVYGELHRNDTQDDTTTPIYHEQNHWSGKHNKPAAANAGTQSSTAASTSSSYPGSVINLINWYLTLPVTKAGTSDPQTIKQPELNTFALAPYFQLNSAHNGIVFQAPAGGATTENSKYPRSELREMTNNGADKASWSSTSGSHTMIIRQAITHLPSAKPEVVAGQIHDASDDVVMIRLEGHTLFVEANGKNIGVLDGNYQLGATFVVQITAESGHIRVAYNGNPRVDYAKSGSGFYFKAGCYTQSNPSKGDSPSAYGEVIIYGLQISHS